MAVTRARTQPNSQPCLPSYSITTMADKATASKASDTDFRKKWDKEEYADKAKKRDLEEKERMQENEERMKQGK